MKQKKENIFLFYFFYHFFCFVFFFFMIFDWDNLYKRFIKNVIFLFHTHQKFFIIKSLIDKLDNKKIIKKNIKKLTLKDKAIIFTKHSLCFLLAKHESN